MKSNDRTKLFGKLMKSKTLLMIHKWDLRLSKIQKKNQSCGKTENKEKFEFASFTDLTLNFTLKNWILHWKNEKFVIKKKRNFVR